MLTIPAIRTLAPRVEARGPSIQVSERTTMEITSRMRPISRRMRGECYMDKIIDV
jgi:hypothetical protein